MYYISSRGNKKRYTDAEAIVRGLAEDGGLFVPEEIPSVSENEIRELTAMDYTARAVNIMARFLPSFDVEELKTIARESYGVSFNPDGICAPLAVQDAETGFLELYHGPTCAFKDMALQIMPRLLVASLRKTGESNRVCILVATSGDTGKAALEGFCDVEGTAIQVFYPCDGVSDIQKLQMCTQKGNNVSVMAVQGNFDDAQSGVKAIFSDEEFRNKLLGEGWILSSANSINWGRLLPQIVYYFSSYCDFVNNGSISFGDKLSFCVPTGNFGDILAGWYAKKMGLPVDRLICASNRNNVLTDFFASGEYNRNRPFYKTTSPSMDILLSSNLERLLSHLFGVGFANECMLQLNTTGSYRLSAEQLECVRSDFDAGWADVDASSEEISKMWSENGYLCDPHTAVASAVLRALRLEGKLAGPAVVVSTASPYKFCDTVLTAIGETSNGSGPSLIRKLSQVTETKAPASLTDLDKRPLRFSEIIKKEDMNRAVLKFLKG